MSTRKEEKTENAEIREAWVPKFERPSQSPPAPFFTFVFLGGLWQGRRGRMHRRASAGLGGGRAGRGRGVSCWLRAPAGGSAGAQGRPCVGTGPWTTGLGLRIGASSKLRAA